MLIITQTTFVGTQIDREFITRRMVRMDTSTIRLGTIVAALAIAVVLTTAANPKGDVKTRDSDKDGGSCAPSRDTVINALRGACGQAPTLTVRYGKSAVTCDSEMTIDGVSTELEVVYPLADAEKSYTLLMVDPDAPGSSVDTLRFFIHWALANVKGSDLKTGKLEGKSLKDYFGPQPPRGSGFHRYQFILFETTQQREITLDDGGRSGFSLDKFISDNGICRLVATFEFKVENN